MKSSIIVLPYKILAHSCEKQMCSKDQKKVKLSVKGTNIVVNPFFLTGEKNHSAFPKLIKKDIPFFSSVSNKEVPSVYVANSIKNTKEVNAFYIDYLDGEINDSIEFFVVDGILRHFKVLSNQYWINSPIKHMQRMYMTYPVSYKNSHIEVGAYSEIFRVENYPFRTTFLHDEIWRQTIENFMNGKEIMDKEYFLDGITSFHYGHLKKMIIDFALSVEIPKNRLFKKKWLELNPTSLAEDYNDRSMGLINNYIGDHISKLLFTHFGTSFKIDHPIEYKYIVYLWKFRGKIAHGDSAIIDHDIKGLKLEEIDHRELIRSVKVLRDYLINLENSVS